MKRSLAIISLMLFGMSVIFLIVWTLSESAFAGLSTAAERIITLALLVLPAGIGAVVGVLSLMHREGKTALAITGIVLNTLFALFHVMIVLFAG